MTSPPRVRFAPSPTGELHVGNARTALFNWLFARHSGGRLVLRIEDTDASRSDRRYEAHILDDLRWLGIDWDEGPDQGGDYGPYRQSERLDLYRACLERLIAGGQAYPCYCSDEELEQERQSLLARRLMPRYMGRCRSLTDAERRRQEAEGRRPAWRFRLPDETLVISDRVRGEVSFSGSAIGDFIIVRSNGIPAYNFACVIDDARMAVSHVIRGEDHLSNTALQVFLYRALGFDPPQFAHHPLILGKDRSKLSKRHGAVSVREFRSRGILPEALMNYLALLGASLGEGKEICSRDALIDLFRFDRIGKSGAVFDEDKLLWINASYLHREDSSALLERLRPFVAAAGHDPEGWGADDLPLVRAVQDNLATLADIGPYLAMFSDPGWRREEDARALLQAPEHADVLKALTRALGEEPDGENLYNRVLDRVRAESGKKGKTLFLPIRAAVTGRLAGPELDRIFALLGRERLLARAGTPV